MIKEVSDDYVGTNEEWAGLPDPRPRNRSQQCSLQYGILNKYSITHIILFMQHFKVVGLFFVVFVLLIGFFALTNNMVYALKP